MEWYANRGTGVIKIIGDDKQLFVGYYMSRFALISELNGS
ncbi:MAG: hypothetical protein RL154_464, partial [Pseudomonadota bacterium]